MQFIDFFGRWIFNDIDDGNYTAILQLAKHFWLQFTHEPRQTRNALTVIYIRRRRRQRCRTKQTTSGVHRSTHAGTECRAHSEQHKFSIDFAQAHRTWHRISNQTSGKHEQQIDWSVAVAPAAIAATISVMR